jgi:ankyrin repeat protein
MTRSRILLSSVLLLFGCSKTSAPPAVVLAPVTSGGGAAGEPIDLAVAYGDRTKALHTAAEKGQLSLIAELVKKGANPNDKDDAGSTALHKAVAKNQKQATATLLVLGADQGEKDGQGRNPLHIAAAAGNLEVLKLLLGLDAATTLAGDAVKGISGLAGGEAENALEKIGYAIGGRSNSANASIDPDGHTPLMLAVMNGHLECFQYLFQTTNDGATLFKPDKNGQNAVMMAAASGHQPILSDMLVSHRLDRVLPEHFRLTDKTGKTAMELAEAGGHKAGARTILKAQCLVAALNSDMETFKSTAAALKADFPATEAMTMAVSKGKVEVVRYLQEQAKDRSLADKKKLVDQRDPGEMTQSVLCLAVQGGYLKVTEALTDPDWWKDPIALAAFIRHAPERPNYSMKSALELAKDVKLMEIVDLLSARLAAAEGKKK